MYKDFTEAFLKAIEDNDSIVVFRHIFPDPDAYGSQLGLVQWIKDNWPDKKVYAAGDYLKDQMDQVDEKTIADSLVIVTDTSTADRVDNDKYKLGKESIRIDHHHFMEKICGLELVDEKAAAACEAVVEVIAQSGRPISDEAAAWLYEGLIADTNQFSNSALRKETFEAAAWLVDHASIDINAINEKIIGKDYEEFLFDNLIRNKAVFEDGLLFSLISKEDYLNLGKDYTFAKGRVSALAHVNEAKIWAYFTQDLDGTWNASLRAKNTPIRDLAEARGGGGHLFAAACRNLDDKSLLELIQDLKKRVKEV